MNSKNDKILSFLLEDNKTLTIQLNRKGLLELKKNLDILLEENKSDHIHLFSPEYGGNSLTTESIDDNRLNIHSVKIIFWDD